MAHILIVDDDLDIADASRELLESVGHQISIGRNGEEGLAALSAAPLPDCVLLDLDMPVLNGQGMAHQMLVHDAGEEEVPILLVSGRNDLPAVAARMGTPYFVAKGNGNYGDLLLEMLERVLVERRAPASA
jgi:twitching motility two-component system response regulator PilH